LKDAISSDPLLKKDRGLLRVLADLEAADKKLFAYLNANYNWD